VGGVRPRSDSGADLLQAEEQRERKKPRNPFSIAERAKPIQPFAEPGPVPVDPPLPAPAAAQQPREHPPEAEAEESFASVKSILAVDRTRKPEDEEKVDEAKEPSRTTLWRLDLREQQRASNLRSLLGAFSIQPENEIDELIKSLQVLCASMLFVLSCPTHDVLSIFAFLVCLKLICRRLVYFRSLRPWFGQERYDFHRKYGP